MVGALSTMPGTAAAKVKRKTGGGALAQAPRGFQVGTTVEALNAQRDRLLQKSAKNPTGRAAQRLQAVQGALGNMQAPTPQGPTAGQPTAEPEIRTIDDVNGRANNLFGMGFGQAQDVFMNNPLNMNYETMRQQAEQRAMDSFNRNQQPEFQRQEEAFNQQMAEQGIPRGTKAYEDAYRAQIANPQNAARQNAMDSAFTLGQGEQSQMFGQQMNRAQLPFQQLGALTPFYSGQMQNQLQMGQQNFLQGQNALDREQQIKLQQMQGQQQLRAIRATPRGGGGGGALSLADQMALQNNAFYNNMVLNGLQQEQQMPQQGSAGNSFATGVAQGIGAGLIR